MLYEVITIAGDRAHAAAEFGRDRIDARGAAAAEHDLCAFTHERRGYGLVV